MPRCSVIIPVHNWASLTRQCLDTLLQSPAGAGDFEIVVVDDASSDSTPAMLASYGDRVRTVRHAANAGFGASCNDGAAAASATDYLVFLNNDTIPQSGWLGALITDVEMHPETAVVGSQLLFPNHTIQHAGVVICQDCYPRHIYTGFPAYHPAVNKSRRFQVVTAACALYRRSAFEQQGGFDANFRNGYEDVDLCLRLGAAGWEVRYCHRSVLYHLESLSRATRTADYLHNDALYRERWMEWVRPDEFDYYVEDGLLKVSYSDYYPIELEMSPFLGVARASGNGTAEQLLGARARQVFALQRDNLRLAALLREAEMRATGKDEHE